MDDKEGSALTHTRLRMPWPRGAAGPEMFTSFPFHSLLCWAPREAKEPCDSSVQKYLLSAAQFCALRGNKKKHLKPRASSCLGILRGTPVQTAWNKATSSEKEHFGPCPVWDGEGLGWEVAGKCSWPRGLSARMHFNMSPGRADFSPNLNNSKGVNECPEVQKKYVWGQLCSPFSLPAPISRTNPEAPNVGWLESLCCTFWGLGCCVLPVRALGLPNHRDRERRCCKSSTDRGRGAPPGAKAPPRHTVSPAQGGNSNSCYQFQTTFQRPGTMLNAFVAWSHLIFTPPPLSPTPFREL